MRKFVLKSLFLLVPSVFTTTEAMAQYLIKGKLIDAETKETLIGATAVIEGTTIGAAADIDGLFEINSPSKGNIKLIFRNVGYDEVKKDVKIVNATTNLGTISLLPTAVGLEDVTVIASVVRADRQTPIAISNIKIDVLEEKLGNQEFPEILKQTPSVYATKQGGGFGDSRINMRGFDSNNIGVLVNGVPVNDMENGKVYWSNWSGLSDVTQFMQVQRGLGASKLGLSSAGGTINILTKSTDIKRGGSFYYGTGNDNLQKLSLNMSTGLTKNGWAATFLVAHNKGDGYIMGTDFDAWTYFANISKQLGDKHRLSLTAFGAPQWHNQRGQKHSIADYQAHPEKEKWNSSYGYIDGKLVGGAYGYNEYHKPQISLNHNWYIDETSSLATSVYASIANGFGRRVRGTNRNWLSWDNSTGRPYEGETKLTPEGYLDYAYVMDQNRNSIDGVSKAIFTKAINRHQWYGILSNYNKQLNENLNLTAGYDGRYFRGFHFEEIEDLLGGKFFVDNSLDWREKNQKLGVGDKVSFDSMNEVLWQGLFGQAEYVNDQLSAFLSASLTYEAYRYHDYDGAPIDGTKTSDFAHFLPWSTKAGFNWKFNENNNAFINGGFFTRAPYFNNVFKNNTIVQYDEKPYEKIFTIEGGYTFATKDFTATINAYYTEWLDRGKSISLGGDRYILRGLNARHTGVEFESTYKPHKEVELRGMFSYGDWIWKDNVNFSQYDDAQNLIGTYVANIAGVHVGNSAQMTAAIGVNWTPLPGLKIGADWNYFGKNFADFDPGNRTKEEAVDSWKMPNYSLVDLSASYRLKLDNGLNLSFFSSVHNLLNTKYVADAQDGRAHDAASAMVYYGFGTTWSAGLKVAF